MTTVILGKLTNGEEFLAELREASETSVWFKRPRVLRMMQGHNGEPQPALMPLLMMAPDAEVKFDKSNILCTIEAPVDIEKMYLQQVSRIQLMG